MKAKFKNMFEVLINKKEIAIPFNENTALISFSSWIIKKLFTNDCRENKKIKEKLMYRPMSRIQAIPRCNLKGENLFS